MRTTRRQSQSVWGSSVSSMARYGKWGLWVAVALIALIPLRHLYNWRMAPATASQEDKVVVARTAPAVDPYCTGRRKKHTFGLDKGEPVNEDAQCFTLITHGYKCIYVQQALSTVKQGPFCNPNEVLPNDAEYVWSAEKEPFDGYVELGPKRYSKYFELRQ